MRIKLTEEDFKSLINRKEINKEGIKMILEDIGYVQMINILKEGMQNFIKNNQWED